MNFSLGAQIRPVVHDASYKDEVSRTFTITGNADFIERFENLLAQIVYLGSVGHSCVAAISVDGDGSDRAEVTPKPKMTGKVVTAGKYPDNYEIVRRK